MTFIAARQERSRLVTTTSGMPYRFIVLRKFQCCHAIPALGDIGLHNFTFVIDYAPEVMQLAVDCDEILFDMPRPIREFLTDHPPLAYLCREHRTEPIPPEPH